MVELLLELELEFELEKTVGWNESSDFNEEAEERELLLQPQITTTRNQLRAMKASKKSQWGGAAKKKQKVVPKKKNDKEEETKKKSSNNRDRIVGWEQVLGRSSSVVLPLTTSEMDEDARKLDDAPPEDDFDSHTRVAAERLLRPASSSLAACVCQGTEVDLPLVEALPTPSPESDDGPALDPRQLLAILSGDGAYFADVLCDVECGAGFTLTRLGDRVEARLHPGAAFTAEAAVHADVLIVLRGRDCALRRRGADDIDRTLVDALASTEMRALATKLLPRVDAGAAAALLQSCGRRLQRFAAQHHFLQPLAPSPEKNRLDARVKARDQRGAVSLTLFADGRKRVLLVTERAHFYHRRKIRGVNEVHFYALPERAEFFAELVEFAGDSAGSAGPGASASANTTGRRWEARSGRPQDRKALRESPRAARRATLH